MVNIFKEGKVMNVSPFYFKNVGDAVQGTYIGKRDAIDNYSNKVTTYELKNDTGIWNVSFPKVGKMGKKRKIHTDMELISFGHIVGFKYEARGNFNGTEFKDIKIYWDEKMIDQNWLDEHKDGSNDSGIGSIEEPADDEDADEGKSAGFGDFDKPVPSEVETPVNLSSEELLKQIAELAKAKLGVIDAASVKDRVMEATGLAFLPINYAKILEVLRSL